MGKKVTLVLIVFILLILMPGYSSVKANPQDISPTKYKYINDYTDIINDSTKQYIVSVGNELENKTGSQEVVVIVNSLEGKDIESYANELFRSWGIGQKDKNNGLLILIALNDKKWRVEVGKGLEGTITDIYSARVMDSIAAPKFKEGNFEDGIKNSYAIFADDIAKSYNVTLEKNMNINQIKNNVSNSSDNEIGYIPIIIIFALIILIIIIRSFWKGPRGGSGLGGGGFDGFGGIGGFGGGFGDSGGSSSGGSDFGGFGGGDSGGGGSSGGW